ncbi:hypothetical protein NHX12_004148 [Muraenolepis orangiensis]|uniref:Uncharacterized protein n=1 Tax=Muraenolepis orangiensis TaxID=630683 RepID=A0A9Q0DWH8_9TELE|nr:hypothetical protein NHX12_004148 [Muraenolepis orangiensis]
MDLAMFSTTLNTVLTWLGQNTWCVCVLRRVVAVLRRVVAVLRRVVAVLRRVVAVLRRVVAVLRRVVAVLRRVVAVLRRVVCVLRRVVAVLRRVVAVLRRVVCSTTWGPTAPAAVVNGCAVNNRRQRVPPAEGYTLGSSLKAGTCPPSEQTAPRTAGTMAYEVDQKSRKADGKAGRKAGRRAPTGL